jgi:DNA-binding transcriptional MerR regulator
MEPGQPAPHAPGSQAEMSASDGKASMDGHRRRSTSPRFGVAVPASQQRRAQLPVGSAAISTLRPDPYRYTMTDLEEATGISARNVRYYITQELLPPARGRGVGATYGPVHLLRLQMIARLQAQHMPLKEIRQRLEGLSEAQLAAMLEIETAPPEDRWRRVMLHDDLELHIRERGGRHRDYALEKVADTIVKQSKIIIDQELGTRD